MNDSITDFLDIADHDSEIVDCHIEGNHKYITLQKRLLPRYCPICGRRLHSKGKFTRHPNCQILQDGSVLNVTAIGRRWECSNPDCSYSSTDEFDFIDPGKKNTKILDLSILRELKDLHAATAQVARRFSVSDTYVHDLFTRYVDLKRKPLTDAICIDEVYLNVDYYSKYALVILDFHTGAVLDIVRSRREEITQSYFLSIPVQERNQVKYLICDMYNPYISYTHRYFLHAECITDTFHVTQWLLNKINLYINQVRRRYQARDDEKLAEKNANSNQPIVHTRDSDEVYILKHASWVLLENEERIQYTSKHFNHFLDRQLDTYDWENLFLELDPEFPIIKDLKEQYISFSHSFVNDPLGAEKELLRLIDLYRSSKISFMRDFGSLLYKYRATILNSFKYITQENEDHTVTSLRRLSNGPMESFNNKPSAFRTQSKGIANFEYARNRILWSEWDDAPILAVPKTNKQIHNDPDQIPSERKRGSYNKH